MDVTNSLSHTENACLSASRNQIMVLWLSESFYHCFCDVPRALVVGVKLEMPPLGMVTPSSQLLPAFSPLVICLFSVDFCGALCKLLNKASLRRDESYTSLCL